MVHHIPCCCCCKDVKWHSVTIVCVSERKYETIPLKDLCFKCGEVVHSFVKEDPEDIVKRARVERAFRAEILLMGEMTDGKFPKTWRGQIVRTSHAQETSTYFEVAVVAADAFKAHFGIGADNVPGKKTTEHGLVEFLDRNGEAKQGVIMKLENIPPELPYEILRFARRAETTFLELHMADQSQVRPQQGKDTFEWFCEQMKKTRSPALCGNHPMQALTYDEWSEYIEKADNERKDEDMQREVELICSLQL